FRHRQTVIIRVLLCRLGDGIGHVAFLRRFHNQRDMIRCLVFFTSCQQSCQQQDPCQFPYSSLHLSSPYRLFFSLIPRRLTIHPRQYQRFSFFSFPSDDNSRPETVFRRRERFFPGGIQHSQNISLFHLIPCLLSQHNPGQRIDPVFLFLPSRSQNARRHP